MPQYYQILLWALTIFAQLETLKQQGISEPLDLYLHIKSEAGAPAPVDQEFPIAKVTL